jgi:thioredoxin 1
MQDARGCTIVPVETSPRFRAPASRPAAGARHAAIAAALLGCTALALLAGGCSPKVVHLESTTDFQKVVLEANKPVLIHFWKGGCALCGMLAPIIDKLADEYDGRAVVAGYMLMTLVFTSTNEELRDQYDVVVYPTAILFVNGEEKQRWTVNYDVNSYRKALDQYCAPAPTTQKAPPNKEPKSPASKPAGKP